MLQLRDIEVLASVARYYTLTRAQINRLHFPTDSDGRITRKRLRILDEAGLVNRTSMQVTSPLMGAPGYVYYPSAKGVAFLLQEVPDLQEKLKHVCTLTPNWMHLYHWVEVADTHMRLDQSVAKCPGASVQEWISEWTIANPDEKEPEKRYRLYTRLGPKLVCAPDAGFLFDKDKHRKVFYVEEDRDTTHSADRVAAHKLHGYASLHEQRLHILKHFKTANVERFTVLFVAPTAKRRDALRLAFAPHKSEALYRFAAKPELNAESFLLGPVWHACDGTVSGLLKGGQ